MNRFALCSLVCGLVFATCTGASGGNALTDGGFEAPGSWNAYSATVQVNSSNSGSWWVGGDNSGWIRQGDPSYAYAGQYCAGDADGYGGSNGIVQFVPVDGGNDEVSVSFYHLLWYGEGSTSMQYGVYGWNEGDTIDLGSGGPGADATVILGPKTLNQPQYYGDGSPYDDYSLETASDTFTAGQFNYVGIWMQYELDGGSFYVDDVGVDLAPEPATMLLLCGAAGPLLLKRRRNA